MDKKEFATKIIKCTEQQWYYVLRGKRNLSYQKAELVAQVLNTDKDLWLNPNASVNDRKKAWSDFQEGNA